MTAFFCAKSVATDTATASPSKGSFSKIRRLGTERPASRKIGSASIGLNRFSGQQSSSSSTNGSVTNIGLHIRPSANKSTTSP